jgi:hypothetical protein
VVGAWDSRKVSGSPNSNPPFQLPHPTECGRRSGSQEHSRCSAPPDFTLEVDGLNALLLDRPGRLDPGRAGAVNQGLLGIDVAEHDPHDISGSVRTVGHLRAASSTIGIGKVTEVV